jgi:hypothetical protein
MSAGKMARLWREKGDRPLFRERCLIHDADFYQGFDCCVGDKFETPKSCEIPLHLSQAMGFRRVACTIRLRTLKNKRKPVDPREEHQAVAL